MAKRFRLAVPLTEYPTKNGERPPKPQWLVRMSKTLSIPRKHTKGRKRSFEYWSQIYLATPPWLTRKMVEEMRDIYLNADEDHEVDHIVPLKSPLVCGLHVPWNLEVLPRKINQHKSNLCQKK